MPDIDFLAIEVDGRNQAILIPADIEDDQIVNHVRTGKHLLEIMEAGKVIRLHDPKPCVERRATIRMVLRKGAQCFARDDVHSRPRCHRAKPICLAQHVCGTL